jgi:hypothetical protein
MSFAAYAEHLTRPIRASERLGTPHMNPAVLIIVHCLLRLLVGVEFADDFFARITRPHSRPWCPPTSSPGTSPSLVFL